MGATSGAGTTYPSGAPESTPGCATYLWSFVTQIFHNGQLSHGGDRKTFEDHTFSETSKIPLRSVKISGHV
jgi:superfamily I DNA and/or RNA helicase